MEFTVTRHGEPIMFIHGLEGVTWVDREIVFDRPIEKIGQNLELFQEDILLSNDRNDVIKIVAHWKKRLNKKMRKTGLSLESIVLTGDFNQFD